MGTDDTVRKDGEPTEGDPPEPTFTRAEVDEQLKAERQRVSDKAFKEADAKARTRERSKFLDELGFDSEEEVRAFQEDKKKAEDERQQRLRDDGKWERVAEEKDKAIDMLGKKHVAEIGDKDKTISAQAAQLDTLQIEKPLLEMLSKPGATQAFNPSQAMRLIRSDGYVTRIDGELTVVKPGTDDPFLVEGKSLTVGEFLGWYADENPNLFKSRIQATGAGQGDADAPGKTGDVDAYLEDLLRKAGAGKSMTDAERAAVVKYQKTGTFTPPAES